MILMNVKALKATSCIRITHIYLLYLRWDCLENKTLCRDIIHPQSIISPMIKILYRIHAVQRMFEREISPTKVRRALETEEVIEDYSNEMPEPSRLIIGFQGKRPFHVVTSENPEENVLTVVTVYHPDANKWKKDFRSWR